MEFIYDSGDNLISMLYNGTEYYYIKNSRNNIYGIADISGTVVAGYSYDSWGKVLSITGNQQIGKINPFRYREYYYDSETELYYLNSRYYNTSTGRFINPDDEDIAEDMEEVLNTNLYCYALNIPINN